MQPNRQRSKPDSDNHITSMSQTERLKNWLFSSAITGLTTRQKRIHTHLFTFSGIRVYGIFAATNRWPFQ